MGGVRASVPVESSTSNSKLLTLVTIVVAIGGVYLGRAILMPLALAVVFAFLLTPIVIQLEKWHFKRVPAVFIVLIVCLLGIGAGGWNITGQVTDVLTQLPAYRSNIRSKIHSVQARKGNFTRATDTVTQLSNDLTAASQNAASKESGRKSQSQPIPVQVAQPPSSTPQYFRSMLGPLAGVLEVLGMVVVFTLFMLIKREDLRNRVIRLAGRGHLNTVTEAMDDAAQRLSRYLFLQFVVNASYGLIFGVGLYLIGVPHAVLWGVLSGLLRFIPYIGTPIGALLPMAMALAVSPGWTQVVVTFAFFLVLELTVANIVEPWLYGAHTGVSSLAILVAAIFWATIWGPVGLILSTPLTMCLILIGRYVPHLNFLEVLLGDEPVLAPEAHFYQRLLALDQREVRKIADTFLAEKPLGTFYDSVVIPALSLAEQDRHMEALDPGRVKFIIQSTKDLVEELGERPADKGFSGEEELPIDGMSVLRSSELNILCIPTRDEADEVVATMLGQLLTRAGHRARSIAIGTVPEMLQNVSPEDRIVCLSALPPFAVGQARSLCRQLRELRPDLIIVVGLWNFEFGVAKAQERVGMGCSDMVSTTLAQAVALTNQVTQSKGAGADSIRAKAENGNSSDADERDKSEQKVGA
ncbi:MAG: AI-2E family transporter [Acidobacteriota bacterium]|nr:AI-2E family transporter [Acidobacteriota bacterium]